MICEYETPYERISGIMISLHSFKLPNEKYGLTIKTDSFCIETKNQTTDGLYTNIMGYWAKNTPYLRIIDKGNDDYGLTTSINYKYRF